MDYDFSSISFYNDQDYKEALPLISNEPTLKRILNYYSPGISDEEVKNFLYKFPTILDFQKGFIIKLVEKIVNDSTSGVTFSGIENIDFEKSHLYLTNHRNIVLDSAILNYVFYKAKGIDFQSTAIAIGDNLLTIPWVKALARINKSFLVERGLNPQQLLESSKRLSHYISKLLKEDNTSVWIAQREGRTKDGNDFTQAGLLKMLQMAGDGIFADNFASLNIIPVSISYEFDPCDLMKIREISIIEKGEKYEKAPMEDFNSMFAGIMGKKGRVHFHFGEEITRKKLSHIDDNQPVNDKIKLLGETIDKFIYQNYRLYENNYIAADLLNGTNYFEHLYTSQQKNSVVETFNSKLNMLEGDRETNYRIMLRMLAYPVKNYYTTVDNDYIFNF